MKSRFRRGQAINRLLWLSVLAAPGVVSAAEPSPVTSPESELDEIVVTGTRIVRRRTETASPVQILSRDDLARSGQQNLADILRSVPADGQGTLPTSFSAGFAAGASAISLRGLGVNATLVLVNGRRMAPYGLADDGARVFTDLNSLPLEAVERVEILKDGASASYGSDAIAGVVNIILRESLQGGALSADLGTSYRDDGTTARVSGSYGIGDLKSDGYNLYVTAEGSSQDSISNLNRPKYLGTQNLLPYGWYDNRAGGAGAGQGTFEPGVRRYSSRTRWGTVGVPGGSVFERVNLTDCPEVSQLNGHDADGNPVKSNICLYDQTQWNQIQPETRHYSLYSRGTRAFANSLEASLELGVFGSKTDYIGSPTSFDTGGAPQYCSSAATFLCPAISITLPAGHPDNPFNVTRSIRYRAADIGGRNGANDSRVTRVVAGVKGAAFGQWRWDLNAGYVVSDLNRRQTGFVLADKLQAAINQGRYRINNPAAVSAQTYAEISPLLKNSSKNSLTMLDASLSGDLLELPGGKLGMAAGVEWRKEKTESPPTPYTDTGNLIGLGYATFSSDRSVSAVYAEIIAPVATMLELSAAYRLDHYSDYGSSKTPKVGVLFKPFRQLSLRGTYSEGFRAPGPAESGDSVSFGYTGIGVLSTGNPNLKPETSRSYTLGLVAEPFDGTHATVDYYNIVRRNEIAPGDPAVVIGNLPGSGPANSSRPGLIPGSTIYYNDQGLIGTVSAPYTNANRSTTSGLDADLHHSLSLDRIGIVEFGVSWTHVLKFEKILDDGTRLDYAGTAGPFVLSSATGTPRDRGALRVTWKRGQYTISGTLNHVSGMALIDHRGVTLIDNEDGSFSTTGGEGTAWVVRNGVGGAPACGVYAPNGEPFRNCRSSAFRTFDLHANRLVGTHLELSGSITNLTNKLAPFNPYTYGGMNYNPAWTQSGAIGRFFHAGARYKF
jgi:iron complex outermembrane recepter protein